MFTIELSQHKQYSIDDDKQIHICMIFQYTPVIIFRKIVTKDFRVLYKYSQLALLLIKKPAAFQQSTKM